MPRVVIPVAVEFNGQLMLRPAAVHAAATGHPIHDWVRKSSFLETAEEPALEPAEGHRRLAVEYPLKLCPSACVRETAEYGTDVSWRRPVQHPCLMAGSGERRLGQ